MRRGKGFLLAVLTILLAWWGSREGAVWGERDREAVRKPGLLVMAHGGGSQWNAAVQEAVEPLRAFSPAALALGMAQAESLQEAISSLEAQGVDGIVVVRLFLSGDSFLEQTEYLLGLRDDPPLVYLHHSAEMIRQALDTGRREMADLHHQEAPVPLPLARTASVIISRNGLLDSPLTTQIVRERIHDLSRRPSQEAVLVIGHGEGDEEKNREWMKKLAALLEPIRGEGFAAVRGETLREDWQQREEAEKRIRSFVRDQLAQGKEVIVVPLRVHGFGPYAEVLGDLPYRADGRGLLPHPLVSEWIRLEASAACRQAGWPDPFQP